MSAEIIEMINKKARSPRIHLATSTKDGKPNVVPIGYIEAISDDEILIVDILMDKTRTNLEENPQVAMAVEVIEEFKAYHLKGKQGFSRRESCSKKRLSWQEGVNRLGKSVMPEKGLRSLVGTQAP